MQYVAEHANNKIDLPPMAHLSPHEYSQTVYGDKIKAEEVVEAENKRREADKEREQKYREQMEDL